jgi:SOS-response transcriptional repressor LexA
MSNTLKPLEKKLLRHIAAHVRKHGYQPSYREMANEWGYSSIGYIAALINKMEKKGLVRCIGPRAVAFDHNSY